MHDPSARQPTPYLDLNAVLRELVESAQAILGQDFAGAYLQGSFALGDFDRHSDVDWIVVVEAELSDAQVQALQGMHERLYGLECAWAQHLEGSYMPKQVLRRAARRGTPLWYLDHGSRSLVRSEHDNTLVVRCTLREHGVALAGPSPATLVEPIPVEALRHEIREHMHNWGRRVLAEPQQLNNRFYQGFAVLHYCRMLHDLQAGRVGSKRAGAEWAKANLDPAWAGLIDRAWDGRPDPARSVRQPANPGDFKRTLEFIEHAVRLATT